MRYARVRLNSKNGIWEMRWCHNGATVWIPTVYDERKGYIIKKKEILSFIKDRWGYKSNEITLMLEEK